MPISKTVQKNDNFKRIEISNLCNVSDETKVPSDVGIEESIDYGESSRSGFAGSFILSSHFLLPGLVSRCGEVPVLRPAATIELLILFR